MRSARRACAALLTSVLLGGAVVGLGLPALVGSAAPAAAATAPCVGVIVDARLAGGLLRTGCAKGDPGSGLEALTDAGFTYAFVPRQPGEVCQINGYPRCGDTTTTTYWSYWWRAKGSSRWVYATEGAGTHDPAPGSTEAWVWQEGGRRQPPSIGFASVCPQSVSSPSPSRSVSSTPSRSASRKRSTATARPASTASPTATPARTTGSRTAPPPTSTSAATTAPPQSPSTAPSTATTSPATSSPASGSGGDGGGAWPPMALGAGAVALLGGAALWRGRRSRP